MVSENFGLFSFVVLVIVVNLLCTWRKGAYNIIASLISRKLAQENDERPKKKKRKEPNNGKKTFDLQSSQSVNDIKENEVRQDDSKEESKCEEKKVTKKKKKNGEKVQENGETVNLEMAQLQIEEKNTCSVDAESNITCQARTLQNGLVIEVLESGKSDGKVAVSGKKVNSFVSFH